MPETLELCPQSILCAKPGEGYEIAVVVKQTFTVKPDGHCVLADEQVPIEAESPVFEKVEAPAASSPKWDCDLLAFKEATDVVVQGHAYTYGARGSVETQLKIGSLTRTVRALGDRRVDFSGGRIRFGAPLPFEKIPLRYELAYGGFDGVGFARKPDKEARAFADLRPKWDTMRTTRYHYPRNPTGRGFVVSHDRETAESMLVPNFEFPDDPVTAERAVVGDELAWLDAPLPAGYGWVGLGWFPRIGYLGATREHHAPLGAVPEVRRGWAPKEILEPKETHMPRWNTQFLQGASPGLAIPGLAADAEITLRALWPEAPERRLRLPGRVPRVSLTVTAKDQKFADAHLNAVVIQPDENRVILVWASRFPVPRPYAPQQLEQMARSVR